MVGTDNILSPASVSRSSCRRDVVLGLYLHDPYTHQRQSKACRFSGVNEVEIGVPSVRSSSFAASRCVFTETSSTRTTAGPRGPVSLIPPALRALLFQILPKGFAPYELVDQPHEEEGISKLNQPAAIRVVGAEGKP